MGRNNDKDDYGFDSEFLSQIRKKKRADAPQNDSPEEGAGKETDVYSWTGGRDNMTLHSRFSNRSTGSSKSSDADDEDFFGEKSSDSVNSNWDGNLDYTQAADSDEYGTNYGDSQVGLDEDFDDESNDEYSADDDNLQIDSWDEVASDSEAPQTDDGAAFEGYDASAEDEYNEYSGDDGSDEFSNEYQEGYSTEDGQFDESKSDIRSKYSLYQRVAMFIVVCGLSCAVLGLCIFISTNKDNTSEIVDTQTETSSTSETSVTETTTVAESEETTTAVETTTTAEATTTTVADGTYATLQLGDKNDDVLKLQQRLYDLKYVTKDCVTGYYGEFTAKMVKRFQYNAGLEATGIADAATQAALYADDAPAAA